MIDSASESPLDAHAPLARLATTTSLRLAPETPDVRGWEVTSPAFARYGVVTDLVIDLQALEVRYIELLHDDGRRLLLPIGRVRIDEALDRVVVSAPSCLNGMPEVPADGPSRWFERLVLSEFAEPSGPEEDFYRCPAFGDRDTPVLRAELVESD